jgi:hypothetical protein
MRQIAQKVTENVSNDAKKSPNMCQIIKKLPKMWQKAKKVTKKCAKWCKKLPNMCRIMKKLPKMWQTVDYRKCFERWKVTKNRWNGKITSTISIWAKKLIKIVGRFENVLSKLRE